MSQCERPLASVVAVWHDGAATGVMEGAGAVERSVLRRKVNVFLLLIPIVLFRDQLAVLAEHQFDLTPEQADLLRGIAGFALAALTLIPLAGFVESAVEELAELLGPFIGGLLHTTFGNIAELTIGLSVLLTVSGSAGADIVTSSIAGVIIRNSLLFLGLSTVLGCYRNGHMKFDAENASEYSTVFALAVVGLSLPTIASHVFGVTAAEDAELKILGHYSLSVYLSVVLLISYLAYIIFSVFRIGDAYNLVEERLRRRHFRQQQKQEKREHRRQHRQGVFVESQLDTQALFREERVAAERRLEGLELGGVGAGAPVATATAVLERPRAEPTPERPVRRYARAAMLEHRQRQREERGEEGFLAGHPAWRGIIAAVVLAIATAGVAAMSESFAKSVEELVSQNPALNRFDFFLGIIIIPVLAGMVEFYGSIDAARKNRMEITMAVTAGATIQMVLLVAPIIVLVGAFTGHPLTLIFKPLELIIFGAATFIFMLLSRDGEATWLEGAQLCTLWLLVGVTALLLAPR